MPSYSEIIIKLLEDEIAIRLELHEQNIAAWKVGFIKKEVMLESRGIWENCKEALQYYQTLIYR